MWQGRLRSVTVQKDGYLGRLGRYIERNPVRAGIADAPWEYAFSSATFYVGLRKEDPFAVMSDHPFRQCMGDDEPQRRRRYREYLLGEKDAAEDDKLFSSKRIAHIGDAAFRAALVLINGRMSPRKKGRRRKL